MRVKWSKPTSIYGFGLGEVEMPPPVKVTQEKLAENFKQWHGHLPRSLAEDPHRAHLRARWRRWPTCPRSMFDFPTQTWAKLLFDYAGGI